MKHSLRERYEQGLPPLPLVGREREQAVVRDLLRAAAAGGGGMVIVSGDGGVGKSRLLRDAVTDAEREGWCCLVGRAYPVETGIPYSPFADAFLPLIRSLDRSTLATLTRGSEEDLRHILPAIADRAADSSAGEPAELKARLLWSFTQFVSRIAARRPLLLVLDDLQWADASSLELLHFVARQIGGDRVAVLAAYNQELAEGRDDLLAIEESLNGIGAARSCRLRPLSHTDTAALVRDAFGASEAATREFSALVYGWTRGNPFFLEAVLKTLVDTGRLREVDGAWVGWEMTEIDLPPSVRDAVRVRFRSLSPAARGIADLLAVVGTNVAHEVLRPLASVGEAELLAALEELRRYRLLDERIEGGDVIHDFTHPMVREALYAELGLARARHLHGRVANALEAHWGPEATAHSDELAYHYSRSGDFALAPKALRYLSAAGREALRKHANREASDYLTAALEHLPEGARDESTLPIIEDLARARQRLGDFDGAVDLWNRRLRIACDLGDSAAVARVRRRLGMIDYWRARYPEALEHFAAGLEAAGSAGEDALRVRLHLSRGECWMESGRADEARREIEAALALAERIGRRDLLARVHLGLLLLHTWVGPPEKARYHRDRALDLANAPGDASLRCAVMWGASVLAAMIGDLQAASHYVEAARALADELRSPLHQLRVAEIQVELLSNSGEWAAALDLAAKAIAAARALNHRSSLTRLLVWMGMIHCGQGDVTRARMLIDEAWDLSGAGRDGQPPDVHSAVPAHAGRAALLIAMHDFRGAVEVAEAGLAVADRTGYTVWAIHRLLPTLAEAHMFAGDLDDAARVGLRLRGEAERLGHTLGLAWADACEALLVWLRGDPVAGMHRLRAAADRLESVPVIPDAARLRRHLAARLRDQGDREGALQELRHIHEVFARLGAERELAKTREQIRELGSRPPVRETARGIEGLSAREFEIAALAARGKTNKAIARSLDISPRTVSTHLSNIFAKLEIGSRGELADAVRQLR